MFAQKLTSSLMPAHIINWATCNTGICRLVKLYKGLSGCSLPPHRPSGWSLEIVFSGFSSQNVIHFIIGKYNA